MVNEESLDGLKIKLTQKRKYFKRSGRNDSSPPNLVIVMEVAYKGLDRSWHG